MSSSHPADHQLDTDADVSSSHLRRIPTVVLPAPSETVLEMRGSDANPHESSIQMSWAGARTAEPPSYEFARAPTSPVSYTLSPQLETTHQMMFLPPASSPDARPLFYMTVRSDPFAPWAYATALWRRPGDRDLIGALKWGAGVEMATVSMQGLTFRFKQVLSKERIYIDKWVWKVNENAGQRLVWLLESSTIATCCRWPSGNYPSSSDVKANSIAEFRSLSDGPLKLRLWPAAFAPDLLEHVVFSAWVMKCYVHTGRLLRAPCPGDHKS